MKHIRMHIAGMTCPACERALERALSRVEGVQSARADYAKNEIRVDYDLPCHEDALRAAIHAAGYEVSERPNKGNGLYILVILLGLFMIARELGITKLFQAFPVVGSEQVGYAVLFVIGLFTSVHCIAMCGGINLSQSVTGESAHPLRRSLLYNLGRLTSYTVVGGLLGLLGEAAAITLRVRGIVGLVAGVLMLLMGVNMLTSFGLFRRLSLRLPTAVLRFFASFSRHGPFAIGLVNGLMPCGPLQSMQLYAIASGSLLAGALSMFFFCLGTIPLVLLFGAVAGVLRQSWKKRMLQGSAALLALLGLFMVQNNLALTGVSLSALTGAAPSGAQVAVVDAGVQRITTTLRANGYNDIQVTAGIPVVWTIVAEESALNGCNNELVLPAFNQQIHLEAGETVVRFTPEKDGTYPYSCWMGMLRNTITVVGG